MPVAAPLAAKYDRHALFVFVCGHPCVHRCLSLEGFPGLDLPSLDAGAPDALVELDPVGVGRRYQYHGLFSPLLGLFRVMRQCIRRFHVTTRRHIYELPPVLLLEDCSPPLKRHNSVFCLSSKLFAVTVFVEVRCDFQEARVFLTVDFL